MNQGSSNYAWVTGGNLISLQNGADQEGVTRLRQPLMWSTQHASVVTIDVRVVRRVPRSPGHPKPDASEPVLPAVGITCRLGGLRQRYVCHQQSLTHRFEWRTLFFLFLPITLIIVFLLFFQCSLETLNKCQKEFPESTICNIIKTLRREPFLTLPEA